MKRFVIVTRGLVVTDIIEVETTAEAAAKCKEYANVTGARAAWVKVECLEALADKDLTVQVWLLKKELAELRASLEEPVAKWSNGRPKKTQNKA